MNYTARLLFIQKEDADKLDGGFSAQKREL